MQVGAQPGYYNSRIHRGRKFVYWEVVSTLESQDPNEVDVRCRYPSRRVAKLLAEHVKLVRVFDDQTPILWTYAKISEAFGVIVDDE